MTSLPRPPKIFSLEGEIDLHVAPEISAALTKMIAEQPVRVVVDLSKVNYIDSSGLAALITAAQNVELYGGRLMLTGVQQGVRAILENASLDQFFLIFPHVDAALAAT
ncbi:MAG TPA: STAS domain-containing protein [Chthoniobacterales bacterium]|nr:STAS domain-containing protein [Chthoniobacterales bacterium]